LTPNPPHDPLLPLSDLGVGGKGTEEDSGGVLDKATDSNGIDGSVGDEEGREGMTDCPTGMGGFENDRLARCLGEFCMLNEGRGDVASGICGERERCERGDGVELLDAGI